MIPSRLSQALALTGLLAVAGGWWLRDRLPSPERVLASALMAPRQTPLEPGEEEASTITVDGIVYTIQPLFRYELQGLVVSESESRHWLNISHARWNDSLNVKDLCLIWGRNVTSGIYQKMDFWSGDFTCFCEFKVNSGPEDWTQFREDQISNNHLLPATPALRRRMLQVRRGDQIRLTGFLAEYQHSNGAFHRGTSITRDDTGNGACETILVTDFEMLQRAPRIWHHAFGAGWVLLLASGAVFIAGIVIDARRTVRALESPEPFEFRQEP
jgi:hypothetical protein